MPTGGRVDGPQRLDARLRKGKGEWDKVSIVYDFGDQTQTVTLNDEAIAVANPMRKPGFATADKIRLHLMMRPNRDTCELGLVRLSTVD